MELDYALLRVPLECLSREFRLAQKAIERELGDVLASMESMREDDAADAASVIAVRERLASCVERLESVQARMNDAKKKEAKYAALIAERLPHVGAGAGRRGADDAGATSPDAAAAEELRLARMVGEQLARDGHFRLAERYCRDAGVTSLVDIEVYEQMATVSAALRSHDCAAALDWCAANMSRLRRIDSKLAFELRRQQFVELVRAGQRAEAMTHAAEFLAPSASGGGGAGGGGDADEENGAGGMSSPALAQLQRDMALLAFPDPVRCGIPQYERLFHEDRWRELQRLFTTEACRAYGLATTSPLVMSLRAGLCAVKTHVCRSAPGGGVRAAEPPAAPTPSRGFGSKFRLRARSRSRSRGDSEGSAGSLSLDGSGDDWEAASAARPPRSRSCPACHPHLLSLASTVPACRRTQSHLICRLSQRVMEGPNQPMVLPNGSVYGLQALSAMASANGGTITCPRTGDKCHMRDLRRAYVL
mmetsp:Transcript_17869/g.63081  ORF Transcript_17869/g.63081 Transcript_17869/m.63081 type:complete len:477 (-) Transcript_17869:53-1483(-)